MKDAKKRQRPEIEEFSYEGKYDYAYVEQPADDETMLQAAETEMDPAAFARRRKKQQNAILISMLGIIAALLVAFIVIKQTVFRLSNVVVVGVGPEYHAEIINQSGLLRGQDIFTVDSQAVSRNLDSSNRVEFLNLTVELPNTVCIFVEERQKAVVLQWVGVFYELDSKGRVLNKLNTTVVPEGLPLVVGLEINGNILVGKNISVTNTEKMTYLFELIQELKTQKYFQNVRVISLSSADDVYLELSNGINVRLGNSDNLRAKIGAIIGSMDYCLQEGGNLTLNVTVPERPTVLKDNFNPNSAN